VKRRSEEHRRFNREQGNPNVGLLQRALASLPQKNFASALLPLQHGTMRLPHAPGQKIRQNSQTSANRRASGKQCHAKMQKKSPMQAMQKLRPSSFDPNTSSPTHWLAT